MKAAHGISIGHHRRKFSTEEMRIHNEPMNSQNTEKQLLKNISAFFKDLQVSK